jgi:anti-anti-sigma regulatory factor
MRPHPYAPYSPAEHERVTLGIREAAPLPGSRADVRFVITANLNQQNAPVLRSKAIDAISAGQTQLAIDLGACPDVNPQGRSVLASIGHLCRRAGGALVVEHASGDLRTLFAASGIDKLFTLSPEAL